MWIIIEREYMTRVRKKSFIVMTILMPLLFIGLSVGTVFLARIGEGKERIIQVIDHTGEYFAVLKNDGQYRFTEDAVESPYACLVITGDLLENPKAVSLLSEYHIAAEAENLINSQLNDYLRNKKLSSYNIANIREIIRDSRININLKGEKFGSADASSSKQAISSTETASAVGMIFTFLIYLFIMIYGNMVLHGVMEEKTNRIVEIIISSVKPFDLMIGKLIGIGLVGITQFGVWVTFVALLSTSATIPGNSLFPAGIAGSLADVGLMRLCLFFVLFFVGGYMIYASFFAAIGAVINSAEDSQQYITPITILIVFAFFAGSYGAQNPDGPFAFWASLIPFTSPIVMMIRLPFGVPWPELLLSVVLLFATVIATVRLAAKIYLTGVLMYGKKPTWGELARWLRY
jgi:ABC-2 type transport system permease protein